MSKIIFGLKKPSRVLASLGRKVKYETSLQRQLFAVLDELRYRQEHRRSEAEDEDAALSNAETTIRPILLRRPHFVKNQGGGLV